MRDGSFSFCNNLDFSGDRFLEAGAVSGLSYGVAAGCVRAAMAAADGDYAAFSFPLFWRHF